MKENRKNCEKQKLKNKKQIQVKNKKNNNVAEKDSRITNKKNNKLEKKQENKKNKKASKRLSEKKSEVDEVSLTTEEQYAAMIYKDGAIEELNSRLNVIFILIIISLIIVFLGASKNITIKPDNAYIPVDDNYNIVYGVEEKDTFEPEEVVSFANEAIAETFSFNYLNYSKRLEHIYNTYYTNSGAKSLDRALSRRDFFQYLSNESLKLVDSRILENALIVKEGSSSNGLKAWVLEIKIELTLLTTIERKKTYTYEIIVEQMPVQRRRGQLGISSIQLK